MDKEPSLWNCPQGTGITVCVTLLWAFKWRPGALSMFWASCMLQRIEKIFPYEVPQPLFFICFSSKLNLHCIFQCNIKIMHLFCGYIEIHARGKDQKCLLYLDNTEQSSQIQHQLPSTCIQNLHLHVEIIGLMAFTPKLIINYSMGLDALEAIVCHLWRFWKIQ